MRHVDGDKVFMSHNGKRIWYNYNDGDPVYMVANGDGTDTYFKDFHDAMKFIDNRKFNKSEYDQKYAKDNITRKQLVFNKTNQDDVAMLDWLSKQGNVNSYIKQLIKADMERAT